MSRTWTCQRMHNGRKCRRSNPAIKRNCLTCGKPRPKRVRAAHMAALDEPYEVFLAANGGVERCGICDREPTDKRLDRDHDHKTGRPRGLLCHRCNRDLGVRATVDWLRAALAYVERP